LAAAGNIIVGTLRAQLYDAYRPTNEMRPPEWDVITVFERILVDRSLSDTETQRLDQAVSDDRIRERIHRVGLGEYVGAAEQISDQLRLGPSVNPVGYALVQGAADWRRIGILRPVPADILSALAGPHLDPRGRAKLRPESTSWAATRGWRWR
jgi:hypothetical protein